MNLTQFKREFVKKISENNVSNWDELERKIFSTDKDDSIQTRVKKWAKLVRKIHRHQDLVSLNQKQEMFSFLHDLENEAIEIQNFDKLVAMIDDNDELSNDVLTIDDNWFDYRRSDKISDYVYNKLKDKHPNVLKVLSNVINEAVSNNECPFTDSWLMLSKKINEQQFIDAIENCAKLGMPKVNLNVKMERSDKNNEVKTDDVKTDGSSDNASKIAKEKDKHETFFKNFMLPSNVFAQPLSSKREKAVSESTLHQSAGTPALDTPAPDAI